jgi:hypothetical protein
MNNNYDHIQSLDDILRLSKPTVEERRLVSYKGKSKTLLRVKYRTLRDLLTRVYNGKWKADYSNDQQKKWFPWIIWNSKKARFVFYGADYDSCIVSDGVPAWALETSEAVHDSWKKFEQIYLNSLL